MPPNDPHYRERAVKTLISLWPQNPFQPDEAHAILDAIDFDRFARVHEFVHDPDLATRKPRPMCPVCLTAL